MAKIGNLTIYLDPYGNGLTIFWGDPASSAYSDEAEKTWHVIMKDKNDVPIGFEQIGGLFPEELDPAKYLPKAAKYLLEPTIQIAE